jgi:hypothetical protein
MGHTEFKQFVPLWLNVRVMGAKHSWMRAAVACGFVFVGCRFKFFAALEELEQSAASAAACRNLRWLRSRDRSCLHAERRNGADVDLDRWREFLAGHHLNGLAEAVLVVELECFPGNR